jgi:DNA-binding NarL/FixJ family response regulator
MAKDVERPWTVYKQKNGAQDRIMEPGWAGQLGRDELERLQQALATDPDLARVWGWRPSMKRRATAAIERVAVYGSPDDIALNRKLVREFSRTAQQGNERDSLKVKQSTAPAPARPGRRRIETWESELLRMASAGMGCKAIAKSLQGQGVAISHATVANRLRELKGQLRLIS